MNRTDFTPIETHLHRARLERVAFLADLIAEGIVQALRATQRAAQFLRHAGAEALRWPESYSTSISRRPRQA